MQHSVQLHVNVFLLSVLCPRLGSSSLWTTRTPHPPSDSSPRCGTPTSMRCSITVWLNFIWTCVCSLDIVFNLNSCPTRENEKSWFPLFQNGDVCISILHPPVDDPQSGELPSERWNPTQNVRLAPTFPSYVSCFWLPPCFVLLKTTWLVPLSHDVCL